MTRHRVQWRAVWIIRRTSWQNLMKVWWFFSNCVSRIVHFRTTIVHFLVFMWRFFLSIPTSNVLSSLVLPHVSRLTSHALQQKQSWLLFTCPSGIMALPSRSFDVGHETRDVSKRHGTTGHETQEIAWFIIWLRLDRFVSIRGSSLVPWNPSNAVPIDW